MDLSVVQTALADPVIVQGLTWIIAGGSLTLVAALSVAAERMKWFQDLAAEWKAVLQASASIALALGAKALLTAVDTSVFAALDPWVGVLMPIFSFYGLNQLTHTLDKVLIRKDRPNYPY